MHVLRTGQRPWLVWSQGQCGGELNPMVGRPSNTCWDSVVGWLTLASTRGASYLGPGPRCSGGRELAPHQLRWHEGCSKRLPRPAGGGSPHQLAGRSAGCSRMRPHHPTALLCRLVETPWGPHSQVPPMAENPISSKPLWGVVRSGRSALERTCRSRFGGGQHGGNCTHPPREGVCGPTPLESHPVMPGSHTACAPAERVMPPSPPCMHPEVHSRIPNFVAV